MSLLVLHQSAAHSHSPLLRVVTDRRGLWGAREAPTLTGTISEGTVSAIYASLYFLFLENWPHNHRVTR